MAKPARKLIPELHLSPLQQRMYAAVKEHPGITMPEVFNVIYSDDPDGGPQYACIHVNKHALNQKLTRYGEKIIATQRRHPVGYRIVKLSLDDAAE